MKIPKDNRSGPHGDNIRLVLCGDSVSVFVALTAIFAKIGIQCVDSDLATLIRTAIILVVLTAFAA